MKPYVLILSAFLGAALFTIPAYAEAQPAAQIVPPKYEHLPAREFERRRAGIKRIVHLSPMLIQKIDVVDDSRMSSGEIAIPDVPRPTFKKYQAR
ncbi:MAG: hypothetical protein EYC62_06520 [Alphaproteobacteria bacterium]|nr:MAG: hypothetical protein EYC62_06520 [Alphaproteobacteria bacterium]